MGQKRRRGARSNAKTSSGHGGRPRNRTLPGLPARKAALEALTSVVDNGHSLDAAIERPGWAALSTGDRAFARAIVATALRRLGELDRILAGLMDRPLPNKALGARRLLNVGMTQILYLRTADHAAVSTTVALADTDHRTRPFKALINAVLRRLIRDRDMLELKDFPVEINTPAWLFDSWISAYGEETARAIARAHLAEASLDVTARADRETVAERLGGIVLPTGTIRVPDPQAQIAALPGFDEGQWWVQDAAASLPVKLLGDVAGRTVLDLCAAPGGKTAQLAAAGARVTAVDISDDRLLRVQENLARLGLLEGVEIVAADVLRFEPDAAHDAVLLDAPCSATGTIRRHPDVVHLKTRTDIKAFAELQRAMLERALSWLKPSGTLVFCTCSLQVEEGATVIDGVLSMSGNHRRRPVDGAELQGLRHAITPQGDLRTLPHMALGETEAGLDGFFAARLVRA